MFNDRYGTLISILVGIATIYYLGLDIKCAPFIDSAYILQNLRSRLYGQDEVIKSMKRAFDSRERIKIMVFIGGVGSGKTYASEIISENVNDTQNFHRLVFQSMSEAKMNLSPRVLKTCDYNMIVIDDLSVDNVDRAVYLLDHIYSQIDLKTNKLDAILIFNIGDIPENPEEKINNLNIREVIHNHLQVLNFPIFMFEFKNLDEVSIKKCVINSLSSLSLETSEENINLVMKLLGPKYSGCKEVFAKASVL